MARTDQTWRNRVDRRYGWLVTWAFAGSKKPVPMSRVAAASVAYWLMRADRYMWVWFPPKGARVGSAERRPSD
ncbi:MAG: hypothetical protein EOP83_24825 [Verrucomicrobiaceae bacterium]|nr:MAG: hypothetical protein EOP83_24825 [Verrucomicrobiaceae bacterium]